MAPPKIVRRAVDPVAADAAYAELDKFVKSRNPDVVNKKPDMALDFELYMNTPDLQETNALVINFLDNEGKRLAAEFLETKDARLVRSFVVLYCARQTRKINTGLGKVTVFLALGPLSCENGLPKFENNPNENLTSGDALLVGAETPHMLDTNVGGGFAHISDWTA